MNMETAYARRVRETVEQVQGRGSIRVERHELGPLVTYMEHPEDALKIAQLAEGRPLPKDLSKNFHRHSRVIFSWRARERPESISGEFCLTHTAEAVAHGPQKRQSAEPASEPRAEAEKLMAELRVFGTHPVGGTGTYSALRLTSNEDSEHPEHPGDFRGLDGDLVLRPQAGAYSAPHQLREYLDVTLLAKGLHDWQYLYAAPYPGNYGMGASLPYLWDGLDFLAREFPDDDLSKPYARLEDRTETIGAGS
ncbi:hypothetical protein [Kitasatospora albolonga]|uniref:hypothetical protein n=1 Tax=Kitasatospora albolonga TaxID=68173 RepID=UPI00131B1D2B